MGTVCAGPLSIDAMMNSYVLCSCTVLGWGAYNFYITSSSGYVEYSTTLSGGYGGSGSVCLSGSGTKLVFVCGGLYGSEVCIHVYPMYDHSICIYSNILK